MNDLDSVQLIAEQIKILIEKVDRLEEKLTTYEVQRAKDDMLLKVTATKVDKLESEMAQQQDVLNKHIQNTTIRQKQRDEEEEKANKKLNTRIALIGVVFSVLAFLVEHWYMVTFLAPPRP